MLVVLDCEFPAEVVSSTGTGGNNIFDACNNKYWKSPVGKTGENAELIIDLKCLTLLETFSVVNGFGGFGTKEFSLEGAQSRDGPWTMLHQGELKRGLKLDEEVRSQNLEKGFKLPKSLLKCITMNNCIGVGALLG